MSETDIIETLLSTDTTGLAVKGIFGVISLILLYFHRKWLREKAKKDSERRFSKSIDEMNRNNRITEEKAKESEKDVDKFLN